MVTRRQMKIKPSMSDRVFDAANVFFLTIILLVVAYPLYFVVIASFSNPDLVNTGKVLLWPREVSLDGYQRIFSYQNIWVGYRNTILYTVVGTFISLCLTMGIAYPLSNPKFSGKKVLMILMTITMFFSGGLIPTYLLVQSLGIYNTHAVMVLLGAVNVFYVIIARTFISSSIPAELEEAALIDGCTQFRYFFWFVLPLSKALLAVLALNYGIGIWNDYMRGLIYLRDQTKWPLQMFLRTILVLNQANETDMMVDMASEQERLRMAELIKYGIIIVSSAPMLAVYPFLQKYFAKGVMIGSLKG